MTGSLTPLRAQYFNNEMVLAQLGITTVPLVCHAPSFQPSPKDCEALITEKTRAIVLVTPNNPTGAIYTDELLHEFAELAIRRGVALVLGECRAWSNVPVTASLCAH